METPSKLIKYHQLARPENRASLIRVARDVSLAFTGAATVLCFSIWAPVLRHLWVLEQVGMLVRYAVWFAFAPVALCTAWDAGEQKTVGQGLLAASLLLGGAYLMQCWRSEVLRN